MARMTVKSGDKEYTYDRKNIQVLPKTHKQIAELAIADRRSIWAYLELHMDKVYKKYKNENPNH